MAIDWGFTIRKILVYGTLLVLYALAMTVLFALFPDYWFMILLFSGGFVFLQYFLSDRLVLWSTGARVVSVNEAPRLHMIIENLALKMGLPKPKVAIVGNDMPNAFATGRNYRNSVVAVTSGLLNRLNEQELQAVLAHEMSHVKNRDMFVITFVSFLVSVISYMIYFAFSMILRDDRNSFGASMAAWFVSILFSNTIGLILINTVSRYREYGADRGAALTTRNPDALISALKKIAARPVSGESARALESAKALCISPTAAGILELFSTHPSMEKRIANLEKVRAEIRGY
ncbi:MAG: heat shock protein HtpX [Methanocella sp. PtaU1.Bin125]|nr:MAG: heat shock protein HtpX [Methanocella sp. PtaU1.Bin125]